MSVYEHLIEQEIPSFWVVRPDAIGDLVLSIPVLNTLKKWYPQSKTTVLMNRKYEPILSNHPSVDTIAYTQEFEDMTIKEKAEKLKSAQIDVIVFLQLEPTWVKAAKLANIPIRLGDKGNMVLKKYLTHPVHLNFHNLADHIIEQNLSLLTPLMPAEGRTSTKMDLVVGKDDIHSAKTLLTSQGWQSEPLIVIQPCTGGSDREWLPEHFTHLIRLIHHKTPYRVVLTGAGPRETAIIQEISDGCKVSPYILTDLGTLPQLKGILSLSACFIGTNTGPMHMAAALKKPVVALFPSKFQKPLQWGPWRVAHAIMRETGKCPYICQPLQCEKDDCLVTISPQSVFDAVLSLMGESESYPIIEGNSLKQTKCIWFQQSATILIYISRDHDLAKAIHTYRLCQEQNLKVVFAVQSKTLSLGLSQALRLSQRRIHIFSSLTPLKWVNFCAKKDITVIHMLSGYNPLYMTVLRSLMALKMYVPPLIVLETNPNPSSLGNLAKYFLKKFRRYA